MIEIKNLSRKLSSDKGMSLVELKNISLQIADSKITSLIGQSDVERSTLLQIIAGLKESTPAEFQKPVNAKIIIIPSAPSSFPWLDVFQNIIFGLDEWDEKPIKELIGLVGLEGYEKFHPDNKSIGFRFRIALARSLAQKPNLIVMDEPFTMMDNSVRDEIYSLIRVINQKTKTTFLLATSNITEAIFLSDKIYLLKSPPAEIFSEIGVDLSFDRDLSIYSSDKFKSLRAQIETSFINIDSEHLFHLSI